MPYIDELRRKQIKEWDRPRTAGELNWVITTTIIDYLKHQGISYESLHSVGGILDDVRHEYKRRVQDPYEDRAIIRNGDVYQDLIALLDEKVKV